MTRITSLMLATALSSLASPVFAQSQGDFTVGIGLAGVIPEGSDGVLAGGAVPIDVGNGASLTLTGEYFIFDNIGIELLAAYPFKHEIRSNGGVIGEVEHLPPTLSLQYHFTNDTAFKPFVGLGVNYTTFTSDTATGALAGNALDLDDSFGVAVHAGIDYRFSANDSMRVDVRWMNIESDVKLNGVDIGKAEINPWIFGVSYIHKF
ncbi:MAG: OmpW family outer membrane protein [Pseudomonadota bacterium]